MTDCEHNHEHENESTSKRLLAQATIVNGLLGAFEVVAGTIGGGRAVQADAVHNSFDTAMYGLKWRLSGKQDAPKINKYRKRIMQAVCLGALVVGVRAGVDIMENDNQPPEPIAVGAAVAAGVANVAVATRLHKHKDGAGGVHHDGMRHAASDAAGSFITVGSTLIAYNGLPIADSLGAVVIAGVTVVMNYPTQARLNEGTND